MSSKRHHPPRHHSDLPSTNNRGPRRPPKQQQQQRPVRGDSNNLNKRSRPTHFLALPIGHHPELRNAISTLTSSWLAYEPAIEGLDPSIVVHPRRLHLTLGVMTLTSGSSSNKYPTANNSGHRQEQEQEQQEQRDLDLPSAAALLDSLAPRLRALLAQNPLRVPLGGLKVMQPDPARAHVLYAEPDLRSLDGRRLRAVCGACCCSNFYFFGTETVFPTLPPSGFLSPGEDICTTDQTGFFRASLWCFHGSWLSH